MDRISKVIAVTKLKSAVNLQCFIERRNWERQHFMTVRHWVPFLDSYPFMPFISDSCPFYHISYSMYWIRYSRLFHLCLAHKGGARILVQRGGGHRTKFHTWIPLKSCTAMAPPKFQFCGGHSAKMYSSKNLEKIFFKFIKQICTQI